MTHMFKMWDMNLFFYIFITLLSHFGAQNKPTSATPLLWTRKRDFVDVLL